MRVSVWVYVYVSEYVSVSMYVRVRMRACGARVSYVSAVYVWARAHALCLCDL